MVHPYICITCQASAESPSKEIPQTSHNICIHTDKRRTKAPLFCSLGWPMCCLCCLVDRTSARFYCCRAVSSSSVVALLCPFSPILLLLPPSLLRLDGALCVYVSCLAMVCIGGCVCFDNIYNTHYMLANGVNGEEEGGCLLCGCVDV